MSMTDHQAVEAQRLLLRTDLRCALGAVYDNPGWLEVDALIDQMEDRGLRLVREP
jgi:hypothetical protein